MSEGTIKGRLWEIIKNHKEAPDEKGCLQRPVLTGAQWSKQGKNPKNESYPNLIFSLFLNIQILVEQRNGVYFFTKSQF